MYRKLDLFPFSQEEGDTHSVGSLRKITRPSFQNVVFSSF
jgi:hypothetical protein